MRHLNQVQLNALRAVEAVARHGNLKGAAEEIGVTPGAVSQHLQKAEQQLGMKLFERTPRGLLLTEAGAAIHPRLNAGFQALAEGVAMAGKRSANTLTVSAAPVFAAKWLVWNLRKFSRLHPEIRVRLEATVTLVDPDSTDIDLCIRVGKGPYKGVRAERLLEQKVFPVCTPRLAEQIRSPRDILKLPVIHDPGQSFGWPHWMAVHGLSPDHLPDGPTYSDGSLCLDAAIAGQGVFLAWESLASHALKIGQLVAPFPGRQSTQEFYWLITSAFAPPSPSAKAFTDWIKTELPASLGA